MQQGMPVSNSRGVDNVSGGVGVGGEEDQSDNGYGNSDQKVTWIAWFCGLKGNEFFCQVEESFLQDSFNLTGLNTQVPCYDHALDMILEADSHDTLSDEQQEMVENDSENLYGLVHARYILTARGLHVMCEKYRRGDFGRCPRVLCRNQCMLPVGMSDTTNQESVKLYCPSCEDVYMPKSSRHDHIDGAYFGTTFAHLFFLTYPELKPAPSTEKYIPRVFGFRVNKNAYTQSLQHKNKSGGGSRERNPQ